ANLTDMLSKFMSSNTASSSESGTLPSNTIANPKEELKGITTRSGVAYQGPKTPSPSKQGTEVTKDQVQTPSSQSTVPVQPPISQSETPTLISEPVVAPVSAPMPNVKSSIPYPLRRNNERRRDQANEQTEKFYEIFKDMSFEISFTDALILMPKFDSTLKALIANKEKLNEMARTSMNEHCLAVILNKLPRKLGDLGKFLIPYEFPGMDECLALADLGASINLMPFSVWEALSLSELTPTCMTLELADRSVSLKMSHLKLNGRALINVHKGELTLRIGNESITYNLDQTVRDSDFLLFEEADAFLGLEDDPNLPKINPFYYDPKGDILLLESILSSEPLPPLPNHEQYMPLFKKELKENELIPTRLVIGWRVCIDYRKLNEATRKYHFPLPFMDQMLERLAGNEFYCFLDGFSGYFQISIDPRNQEKTTFTCPYGTFAYRRMPFGLYNAPSTFQRCMLAIFHDMVEKTMEVFMDDLSVFGNSFENCLSHLDKMLQSAPWFADFANYHAGNFIVKEYKTPIGCTPYKLVYGKACHLLIELEHKAYWALKQANFDITVVGDHWKIQLNELNEIRDHAYENSLIYKEKTKRIHGSKISGKLKTRWSGPFTIAKVFPYGTIELCQANRSNFKVNGHRVKHYFGGDVP
nr:reverse transcriptase domain-containing protein [Tanacetum cinerariifolium]